MWSPGPLARRRMRWAYALFVAQAVLRIPARTGFSLQVPTCEVKLDLALAALSLTKYAHIVLFGLFFLMTWAVLTGRRRTRFAWAMTATLVMGLVVELEQGATGTGNCRMRDLIPDAAGGLVALALILLSLRASAVIHARRVH